MKVAIVGSRSFNDYERLEQCIASISSDIEVIVSGGAKGADSLAANYAREHGIELEEYLPEYSRYGRAATIVRNRQIVDASDMILAFWDGCSKGTKSTLDYARKCNKQVVIEMI